MGVVYLVLLIVFGLISIVNSVFLVILNSKVKKDIEAFNNKLTDLHLDSKISDIFSESMDHESLHKLTNNLFKRIKEDFNLKANNHSELVEELKKADIDDDLKEALVDFFQQMIIIAYKEEEMEQSDKEALKKKIKMIIKMLNKKSK